MAEGACANLEIPYSFIHALSPSLAFARQPTLGGSLFVSPRKEGIEKSLGFLPNLGRGGVPPPETGDHPVYYLTTLYTRHRPTVGERFGWVWVQEDFSYALGGFFSLRATGGNKGTEIGGGGFWRGMRVCATAIPFPCVEGFWGRVGSDPTTRQVLPPSP